VVCNWSEVEGIHVVPRRHAVVVEGVEGAMYESTRVRRWGLGVGDQTPREDENMVRDRG